MSQSKRNRPASNPSAKGSGTMSAKQSRREELRAQREAELRAAQRRRRLAIGSGIVALVVLVAGVVWGVYTFKDRIGATNAVPPRANGDRTGMIAYPNQAKSGAPLLVIYEDFQCPFCKVFHDAFDKKIRAAAQAGEIQLEYRVLKFLDGSVGNDASTRSTIGATCADNAGAFLEYHDQVFAHQPAREGQGYSDQLLRVDIPSTIGLSGDRLSGFQQCYDTKATLQFVNGMDAAAARSQVTSTPTYQFNGTDVTKQLNPNNPASIDPFLKAS
jgi:DSBA-like thioredoxin domain protein